jgi:hypothetical protein
MHLGDKGQLGQGIRDNWDKGQGTRDKGQLGLYIDLR